MPRDGDRSLHAQQAAEKYLKGFLAYRGIDPPRTHDLTVLVKLGAAEDATLGDLAEAARFLLPFAVHVRYPFVAEVIGEEEAALAFRNAQKICSEVRARIMVRP